MSARALDTERLMLREPHEDDADVLRAYYRRNAERFARWEPDRGDDLESHRAWARDARARGRHGEPSVFLAFDRATGALVAVVDVHGFTDDAGGQAMLAYTVDGAYEGRGYASEAVAAAIAHARERLGVSSLTAYFEPDNVRSARLLERAGFRIVAQTPVVPGFERLMRVRSIAVRNL